MDEFKMILENIQFWVPVAIVPSEHSQRTLLLKIEHKATAKRIEMNAKQMNNTKIGKHTLT